MNDYNPEVDRLHLVTHSWGTIILFDVLFAARWDEENMPDRDSVERIRDNFFGVPPNQGNGIRLASIHTMGSPIILFDLMDVDRSVEEKTNSRGAKVNTHDVTPRLEKLLDDLHQRLGCKLPWRNFIHPGDPIAYPLAPVLPDLVDGRRKYIDIQDVVTYNRTIKDFLTNIFSWSTLSLLHGGVAHDSYWHSAEVAHEIAEVIRKT